MGIAVLIMPMPLVTTKRGYDHSVLGMLPVVSTPEFKSCPIPRSF